MRIDAQQPVSVATAGDEGIAFVAHRDGVSRWVHEHGGRLAILFVIGVMDVRAMAVIAAAIAVERAAPAGERVARAIGVVVVGAGLFLIARAVGLG